jgi:putative IMPACT (imprinted ancient) family translation regulator
MKAKGHTTKEGLEKNNKNQSGYEQGKTISKILKNINLFICMINLTAMTHEGLMKIVAIRASIS